MGTCIFVYRLLWVPRNANFESTFDAIRPEHCAWPDRAEWPNTDASWFSDFAVHGESDDAESDKPRPGYAQPNQPGKESFSNARIVSSRGADSLTIPYANRFAVTNANTSTIKPTTQVRRCR